MVDSELSHIPIRRIVAGHDKSGKSVILSDGEATNYQQLGARRSTLMWATKETPAEFLENEDAGLWKLNTPPPPGGTCFRIIESAPGARYPALHRTDTIDYVICLRGEITMDLDDSTIIMKAGDVLIQLGNNHGWRNDTNKPALVAFVLVDGKPKNSPKLPTTRMI
ncbi:MAG: cupin domain-containing protein [Acidimicrobiaceae bacterium]|nr:cupin domain-containing protein [Acidimicrobiaceae bacterium]